MREIRQSGSEGGGGGASPYPYSSGTVPRRMAGTSPAMTVKVNFKCEPGLVLGAQRRSNPGHAVRAQLHQDSFVARNDHHLLRHSIR